MPLAGPPPAPPRFLAERLFHSRRLARRGPAPDPPPAAGPLPLAGYAANSAGTPARNGRPQSRQPALPAANIAQQISRSIALFLLAVRLYW